MPYLIILGILVFIIGAVIFTVNKRDSDHFIEEQINQKHVHREEAENLHTFKSDPTGDKEK
ncbi:MAG: hypothetical protein KBS66_07275 [Eubacterium sp.]|nr:hypothetical protein [Candidatus Colimonas fimequi]